MSAAVTLVIIIALFLLWPRIIRWLRPVIQRWMMRRVENYVRKAAGMPPRQEARKKRSPHPDDNHPWQRAERPGPMREPHIIPPEYAEDVEFTETVEYSSDRNIGSDAPGKRVRNENQVSDAEWEEIS